jgi:hypothetical protein
MSERYDIVERLWKQVSLKINVIKLSPDVISEKLAILSDGSGIITSGEYDQFVINISLLDVPSAFKLFEQLEDDPDLLVAAAKELRSILLEVNPLLDPELLVYTAENMIKIPEQSDKPTEVRVITSNPLWSKCRFKEEENPSIEDMFSSVKLPIMSRVGSMMSQDTYETHIMKELDRTLSIIKFDPDRIPEIFKEKCVFEDSSDAPAIKKFKIFIASKCLDDFTQLLFELDKEGATDHFGEDALLDMLYDACIEHNPFLDWNDIDLDKVKRVVMKMFGDGVKLNKFSKTQEKNKEFYSTRDFVDVPEEEILTLPERIKQSVVGQNEVIDDMCEVIQIASCGLKEKNQPIGTFMFHGSTGCGKTFLSKILADELCGSEQNLIRIDCSEYSQSHEVSKLLGTSAGYVGFDEGGYLTNAVMKKPFSVVLFDEIEKAHPRLHNILLQIMDDGRVTSGKGETVSFEESVVILTSNVGVKEVEDVKHRIGFGDVSTLTKDKNDKAISEGLKNIFTPEFINRIDLIKTFNNLTKEDCLRIVILAFNQLNEWLSKNNVKVKYTQDVVEYIYSKGFKPGFGARPLKRTMKKEVYLPISKIMLTDKVKKDSIVSIKVSGDKLVFSAKQKSVRGSKRVEAKTVEATAQE